MVILYYIFIFDQESLVLFDVFLLYKNPNIVKEEKKISKNLF